MSKTITAKDADAFAHFTGASRGIGRAVAETPAMHGAEVWINYHRAKGAAAALAREVAVPRSLFANIGRRIDGLRPAPLPP